MFKKFIYLTLPILLSLFACTSNEKINLEEERENVNKLLDNYILAHENKDINLLLSCISDKPDILMIGTDENELWTDKKAMGEAQKRAFNTFDKIKLSVRDKVLKMCNTGNSAWFYMRVDWYVESGGRNHKIDDIRTTGVLEKDNGKWGIVQLHLSVPVRGQVVEY